MAQVELNIDELKGFVNHIISNNRFLQEQGKLPVATEVVGESGIGKTSTIVEMAKEKNLSFVKLNLAQIEELGDLVGFPIRQFQMYKEKDVTFRGFRHSAGQLGGTGDKQKDKTNRGNEIIDGMTNWENTSVDGERFSQKTSNGKKTKTLDSFEIYSKKKEARAEARKIAKTSIKALR